ncbi:helix-turn-helix domain-containing protein [Paracoccus tibetensis]|uniref:helix-turn-helix domain-containing protein n=1 Tax=Paracoccus tibetensis TaxID=336292 RepID=UPI001C31A12A|nr:helix-turn-helix transcriptional regulator [Paracoccus tibetensis]
MRDTHMPVKHKNTPGVFDLPWVPHENDAMNNIARLRKARGLRQNDLADMVGVTQPHISRIEKGDEGPPLALFRQIADALQVQLPALFTDERTEVEEVLISVFRDLPESRRQAWLEMARLVQIEAQVAAQEADPASHR